MCSLWAAVKSAAAVAGPTQSVSVRMHDSGSPPNAPSRRRTTSFDVWSHISAGTILGAYSFYLSHTDMPMRTRLVVRCALLPAAVVAPLAACIFHGVKVAPVSRADSTTVQSAVKVHLLDGETLVFAKGLRIDRDTVRGAGLRFGITDVDASRGDNVSEIPLDSVAAMESFTEYTKGAETALMTTLGVGGLLGGSAALFKAIFGSCPTIYSDSAGAATLEAEGFPYSLSRLLERRDLHRLRVHADAGGVVSLEVRNEALETHYINQLELLGVTHAADEFVLPGDDEQPLVVRQIAPATRATDRAGNDVTNELAEDDSLVFRSDARTVARVTASDLEDWIDLTLPVPRGADSVALMFHLRNSLLTTVLLYDAMLRPQGARAVDFEEHDLNAISNMVTLGRWYGSRMGLHVSVRRGQAWDEVARVPDAGPIAWRDVAAVVPVTSRDTMHVRLSFVADAWRIGKVRVAGGFRRPVPRRFAPSAVVEPNGSTNVDALTSLSEPDARYLETVPGQRFTVRFETGDAPRDSVRTFLMATEGYYTEWIRGGWVRQAIGAAPRPFIASDSSLAETVRHWVDVAPRFEADFARTRIPVRTLP